MTKEEIRKARQTDLATYLIQKGEPLQRTGRRYKHKEHDSLVITDNAFYWNSRNQKGNAIDFLMLYYGMDFTGAVEELTGIEKKSDEPLTQQTFSIADIQLTKNMHRAVAYLNKTRNIDYTIIQDLIKTKHLFQSQENNNIVFPIYDEHEEIVGAELCGTLSDIRFKGVAPNSKYGYGFNVRTGETRALQTAFFFESAIDLISYIELLKLNLKLKHYPNAIFISMAGLKENVIETTLKAFKTISKSFLCIDRDIAGDNFINSLKIENRAFKRHIPNKPHKDWNEFLKFTKENRPGS